MLYLTNLRVKTCTECHVCCCQAQLKLQLNLELSLALLSNLPSAQPNTQLPVKVETTTKVQFILQLGSS